VKTVFKDRWDKADLISYYNLTRWHLQSTDVPNNLLNCSSGCKCSDHFNLIDNYYDSIVCALKRSSVVCVSRVPYKCLKPFWSDELDRLKEISIDMHNLWTQCGKLRSGIFNAALLKAKSEYKFAIKDSPLEFEKTHADEISDYLTQKDIQSNFGGH
jgi:hypothetical protein